GFDADRFRVAGQLDFERYPPIAAMPGEHRAERLEDTSIGRHLDANRDFARQTLAHAFDGQNLCREYSHRFIVSFELAADDRERAEFLQLGGIAIHRMSAPIQAERFLFVCELLGFRPESSVGPRHLVHRSGAIAIAAERSEQRRLAFVAVALMADAVLACPVD